MNNGGASSSNPSTLIIGVGQLRSAPQHKGNQPYQQ